MCSGYFPAKLVIHGKVLTHLPLSTPVNMKSFIVYNTIENVIIELGVSVEGNWHTQKTTASPQITGDFLTGLKLYSAQVVVRTHPYPGCLMLTLQMLRLLSSKAQACKDV